MAIASVIMCHMLVYKFVQKLFLQLKKMILSPTSYCQLLSTSNISNVQDLLSLRPSVKNEERQLNIHFLKNLKVM